MNLKPSKLLVVYFYLLVASYFIFTQNTHSAVTNWIGGHLGDWNIPTNWSGGAVPGPADTINIRAGSPLIRTGGTYELAVIGAPGFAGIELASGTLIGHETRFGIDAQPGNGDIMASGGGVWMGDIMWVGYSGVGIGLARTGGTFNIPTINVGGITPSGIGTLGLPATPTGTVIATTMNVGGFSGPGNHIVANGGVTRVTGVLNIGAVGTGILTVDSGTATIANIIVGGSATTSNGSIILASTALTGLLETNSITAIGGVTKFTLAGGILRALSNNQNFITGFSPGQVVIPSSINGPTIIDNNGFQIGIDASISEALFAPLNTVLTSMGLGTLTLTGDSTYLGHTAVASGTLQLGNGGTTGSLAGNISVSSGAVLALNRSDTVNFTNAISGNGAVVQAGSGTTIFSGLQAYTGSTIIQAGELQVNGQISSSNVQINPQGILAGTGTLGSVAGLSNVVNSGIVRPGTSPGILTIQGSYTQTASGTLVIQIAGRSEGEYSRLEVSNTAALDGTLSVNLLNGFEPTTGDEFVILTAPGGVEGTFSIVNEPLGSLLEVLYEPIGEQPITEVILLILAGPSSTTPGTTALSGTHVAGIVEHPRGTIDRINRVLDILGVPFSELVPHIAATVKDPIFGATNIQYSELTTRLAALRSGVTEVALQGLPQEPMREQLAKHEKAYKPVLTPSEPLPWDIYAFASGIFSCMQNVSDLPKIKSQVGYFGAGADYRLNQYVSLGTYVGYQGIWSRFEKNRMQSNGVKWGLYGTAFWEGFYLNAIAGGGANFLNMRRTIDLMDVAHRATSHPFVGELDSLLGGGYEYRWNNWIFGVNNSIQYTYAGVSGFRESGAEALNVKVDRQNLSSLVYTLGGNISYLWQICENVKILPTTGLSWQHEFLNYGEEIGAAFNNGLGAPFSFYSRTGDRNFALGTAGVTAQWGRVGAWAYWMTQFLGSQIYSNAVQVGVSFAF